MEIRWRKMKVLGFGCYGLGKGGGGKHMESLDLFLLIWNGKV